MTHKIVYIPTSEGGLPHVVLAPIAYTLTQAREIVEDEIRKLPADYQVDDLTIALGRRGFIWPSYTQSELAV